MLRLGHAQSSCLTTWKARYDPLVHAATETANASIFSCLPHDVPSVRAASSLGAGPGCPGCRGSCPLIPKATQQRQQQQQQAGPITMAKRSAPHQSHYQILPHTNLESTPAPRHARSSRLETRCSVPETRRHHLRPRSGHQRTGTSGVCGLTPTSLRSACKAPRL